MMSHQLADSALRSGTECPLSAQDGLFAGYELGAAYDEMFGATAGGEPLPRPHYQPLHDRLLQTSPDDFRRRKAMTDLSMRQDGVGFTVYRAEEGIERVWPMDPVPRIIPAAEWRRIEEGLTQRINALNLFLWDVYHDQHILRDGVVPAGLVLQGAFFAVNSSASTCLAGFTSTSAAPTSSARQMANISCSRTTPARPQA